MRISIITATYNRPEMLRDRCLRSIVSQTSKDLEWVVVNDGGDQRLKEVVEAAPDRLDVKYFEIPHRGPIAARNRGLDEATGDLIAFLDDDNLLYDTFAERMLRHFEDHPEIMMSVPIRRQRRDVYQDGVRVRKGKTITRPWPDATNEDFVKNSFNAWFDSNGFVHRPNEAIRFNSNVLIMSDYEYLLQCFGLWGLESFLVCHEELVDYVQSSEGIVGQSSWEDSWKEMAFIWDGRSRYTIFDVIDPEPWLREQVEEARSKAVSGEELPGFPRNPSTGG